MLALHLLSVFILIVWITRSNALDPKYHDDVASILYPNTASYDALIIDPYHIHGSPYGGFSRSVQSRLASLPLHLPEILETASTTTPIKSTRNPLYYEIRDEYGRLFACRQYYDDELETTSLTDSMFSVPILREILDEYGGATSSNTDERSEKSKLSDDISVLSSIVLASNGEVVITDPEIATTHSNADDHDSTIIVNSKTVMDNIDSKDIRREEMSTDQSNNIEAPKKVQASPVDSHVNDFMTSIESQYKAMTKAIEIEQRLVELQSLCGQLHKGWWSYEWCYGESMTQFHLEYDAETNMIHVENMLDLGQYKGKKIFHDVDKLQPNEISGSNPELARITHIHEGGNVCHETGEARVTNVNIICCTEEFAKGLNGMLHKQGHEVTSNIAVFVDIEEDDETLCLYNATVCTPLLCGEVESDTDPTSTGSKSEYKVISKSSPTDKDSVLVKENESIREILDRVLSMLCLRSNLGGWWTYEICYKKQVRQFHEAVGTKRNNQGAMILTAVTEAEHILGLYNETHERTDVPDEEEWKLVINVTNPGSSSSVGSTWGEGSGAYYEIEYTGGDVCDHTDVTDSAIVAGSTTSGTRGLERSSTVRYFCGELYDIEVHEDSTCHYIVQVKVPALCQHRLFRAPTSKKQIIKCLPIDEE